MRRRGPGAPRPRRVRLRCGRRGVVRRRRCTTRGRRAGERARRGRARRVSRDRGSARRGRKQGSRRARPTTPRRSRRRGRPIGVVCHSSAAELHHCQRPLPLVENRCSCTDAPGELRRDLLEVARSASPGCAATTKAKRPGRARPRRQSRPPGSRAGSEGRRWRASPYATPATAQRSAIRRAALRPWLSATDEVSGESTSSSRASRTATDPAEADAADEQGPAVAQRREVSAMRTTIAIAAATQPPRDDVR